jgi:hypothetical protein
VPPQKNINNNNNQSKILKAKKTKELTGNTLAPNGA